MTLGYRTLALKAQPMNDPTGLKLDRLADLGAMWKEQRQGGHSSMAIRVAMLMLANELARDGKVLEDGECGQQVLQWISRSINGSDK